MKAYSSHRDFQWPLLGRAHGRNAETCCSASLQSVSRGLSPAEKETPKKLHAAPSPSDARNERRRTSVARLDAANDASRIAPSRWWVPAEQSYASTAEATIRPSAAGHRASSRYSPDSLAPSAASAHPIRSIPEKQPALAKFLAETAEIAIHEDAQDRRVERCDHKM
jgi:hypothetical protein